MLGKKNQVELPLDEAQPWERLIREPRRAYNAFALYRDAGPRRTLLDAYGRSREQDDDQEVRASDAAPEPVASLQDSGAVGLSVPSSWKKWKGEWRWDERADQFDKFNERRQRQLDDEVEVTRYRRRLEQKLELDDTNYKRLLTIYGHIDLILSTSAIGRIRNTTAAGGGVVRQTEIDNLKNLEVLSKRADIIEDRYFGDAINAPPGTEGNAPESAPVVGEFKWIREPNLSPDEPTPEPSPTAPSDLKSDSTT